MKKLLVFLLLLTPMASPQQTLAMLVDRNRVLLLFAPNALDPRFGRQLDTFNHHEAELAARDLVLIPLLQQPGPANASPVLRNLRPPLIQADEQITIRRRFHITQSEFAIVLLGKDGDEKLRSTAPITLERLTRTIDAMPGRKEELRNQH